MERYGNCPESFLCSDRTHGYGAISNALLVIPAYVGLISSSFSLIGAALILLSYCVFKDLRKGTTQTIITHLALADLIAAITGILGASIFLAHEYPSVTLNVTNEDEECINFDITCQIQAVLNVWALGCGIAWTSMLAIHFFIATISNRVLLTGKRVSLFSIVAWLLPFVIALPLVARNKLGYSPTHRMSCFLRGNSSNQEVAIALFIPEVMCTIPMFLGFIFVIVYISYKQVLFMIILTIMVT